MPHKILTVVGARPQFIKAGAVSKEIAGSEILTEVIIHTGQHYDENMSHIFFDQIGIPKPDYQLDINNAAHGEMTGRMMIEIEKIVMAEKPDALMIYGDTNSTLAGALVASKLHIPVAHVEAGLRSFNKKMPEEINRILTDHVSDILFCPTDTAVSHLASEGITPDTANVLQVGDVMYDSVLSFKDHASKPQADEIRDIDGDYILVTCHRAENTDDPEILSRIVSALNTLHSDFAPVILPLHPRTKAALNKHGLNLNVHLIAPVGYHEMLWLLDHAAIVLTDSGGLQKEAFFFGKPCVTLREQTEWTELVDIGANTIVGSNTDQIINVTRANISQAVAQDDKLYGGGQACRKIVETFETYFQERA